MRTLCMSLATFAVATTLASAQGSLTPPPGSPAPVMKTLDQVEARTPISSAPFTISASGSYYLTGNLSVSSGNAINLNASDVTLDLNGFTISSSASPASGSGILLASSLRNITITNGHIRGSVTQLGGAFSGGGFQNGIFPFSGAPTNARISRISVSGCMSNGISLSQSDRSNVVESCTVSTIGGIGISADQIADSSAMECFSYGCVAAVISNSSGWAFDSAGITARVVQNCRGIGKTRGILAYEAVTNSYGQVASGNGPGIETYGTASFCRGSSQAGFAISAPIAIGCTAGSGTINSAQKHLGTP